MSEPQSELIIEMFHDYGRADFIFRKGAHFEAYVHYEGNEGARKSAYERGYREAEAAMQQLGPVKFYLTELTKMMSAGDEWYGTSFDEPKQLVQWAIEAYESRSKEIHYTAENTLETGRSHTIEYQLEYARETLGEIMKPSEPGQGV